METIELFEQKLKTYLKEKAMRYADSLSSIDKARFEVYDETSMDWFGEHITTPPTWGEGASVEAIERLVATRKDLSNKIDNTKDIEKKKCLYKEFDTVGVKLLLTPREQCLKCCNWGKQLNDVSDCSHCMKGEDDCLFYLYRESNKCPYMETDRKKWDIAKQLSTPRELCKTCGEWNEEDFHGPARCVVSKDAFDANRYYLMGDRDDCPFYFEW